MALRFSCPKCGNNLSAPKECAGRSSKCRACGQAVTVPLPAAAAPTQVPPAKQPPPTLEKPVPDARPARVLDAIPVSRHERQDDNVVRPRRRMPPRPAPLMDGARVIGILLLIFGGLILFLGCAVTGYFVVLFDTTVALDPDLERHGYGYLSPRVNNLGLMHQQTVWTIVGIAVMVIGLALAIVGLVLCVIRREPAATAS